jgi:Lon protease-like protein
LSEQVDFTQLIPIFPLPNVVLLPRTILPLHVFEHRYRVMTRDALAGQRLIAMALLKPGFEANYHTLDVDIYREVCVGRVMREERLTDGRFNFLLQGVTRARVLSEDHSREYRRSMLVPIKPVLPEPDEDAQLRSQLMDVLTSEPLAQLAREANWLELLNCPSFTLSDVCDVLASAVLPCPEDKQHFLTEPCAAARARCILEVLEGLACEVSLGKHRRQRARSWPPRCHEN